MNRLAKEKVYRSVYQMAKELPEVTNLRYPEERKHYDFSCNVGIAAVSFRLNNDSGMYMLRGLVPCGDANKNRFSEEVKPFFDNLEGKEDCITIFAANNAVVIKVASTVAGMDDEKAVEKIEKEAKDFFSYLTKNKDVIEAYQARKGAKTEEKEEATEEEEAAKKENLKNGETAKASVPPTVLASVMTSLKNAKEEKKMPEKMEEKTTPIKKEQPEKAESAQKMCMNLQKLEEEKASFKQYQKDQEHLLKTEKDKLTKRQNKLNKEKGVLENEKKSLLEEREQLLENRKNLLSQQQAFDEKKSKLEEQVLGFKKEQKAFQKEKDTWDATTLDERLIQRRKELEKSENNLYKKEEEFQAFQETTLADIGKRLDDAADKEKELIKQEENFHVRDAKIKECEMDIELRYKKLQDKEKDAAKKEVELSDKEAEIRRTEIVKKEAENKLKQLNITEKNLKNQKEQLDMKMAEFQKRQDAFDKKYRQAMEDLASLDRKKEELKEKEEELRSMIGANEKLEQQLKELKEDTSETRKVLDKKDGLIKAKEGTIKEQKKTIRSLNDELSQMQQKNNSLSAEKKDLQDKLSDSEEKTASLEDEIAKVRSNLYDAKEKIKSAKPTDDKEKNTVLAEKNQLKEENEKLKAELAGTSTKFDNSLKGLNEEIDKSHKRISELKEHLDKANATVEDLKKNSILSFNPEAIGAKEIVSERSGLYAATIDNCTVYVDTENYVLQFQKAVRRPSKYSKKLMAWNENSINETYYITASALCCRKTCRSNITDEMQSVLECFASVK